MKRLALLLALLLAPSLVACRRKKPETFTDVYLAEDHACAKAASGPIFCWGGKYGDVPHAVPELTSLPAQTAKGRAHSCERLANGTVACKGDNSFYQLADSTNTSRDEAKIVYGLTGVTKVVSAGDGNCALLGDGDVRCWGNNTNGQIAPRVHPRSAINVPTSVR